MNKDKRSSCVNGSHIRLRGIRLADATEDYCRWLNDPLVNQYLESRYQKWTLSKARAYIKNVKADKSTFFFAIIRKDSGKHIGTVKFGPVDLRHKHGKIGIIIGDRPSWGKGFATEAIRLAKDYAFNGIGINKLYAGIYKNNVGSIKAFTKAGFSIEGVQKGQYFCKDRYVDCILLGCTRLSGKGSL